MDALCTYPETFQTLLARGERLIALFLPFYQFFCLSSLFHRLVGTYGEGHWSKVRCLYPTIVILALKQWLKLPKLFWRDDCKH